MKKIIIDGTEVEVLDYSWVVDKTVLYGRYPQDKVEFDTDYIKVKINSQVFENFYKPILVRYAYVIQADNRKAEFFLRMTELNKLVLWFENGQNGEIEIEFVGTNCEC